jgi:hypothetical protein
MLKMVDVHFLRSPKRLHFRRRFDFCAGQAPEAPQFFAVGEVKNRIGDPGMPSTRASVLDLSEYVGQR